MYNQYLPGDIDEVASEFIRWKVTWSKIKVDDRPKTILQTLKSCRELGSYLNLNVLLQIFATLPVTSCTSERAFSCLKLIKNYLSSTMGQTRLNGLAALYIHKDIKLDFEKVIDEFGRNNRILIF